MLCYTVFLPYPTQWTLLMQDISLMVLCVLAVLVLIGFVVWLIVIVLLTILLPIYLFSILQPAIRKITLRLQNEFSYLKSNSSNRLIIIGRKEEVL